MSLPPDISLSIVSYNTRELLRACLNSLQLRQAEGEAKLEIIVADNGSRDGSVEMVGRDFPDVQLIETGGNIGFGRAHNRALRDAQGRFFCVFNSDAEALPGALRVMLAWMDAHPPSGACGPQLLWPDGQPQPSHGDDPILRPVLWEQLYLSGLMNRLSARRQTEEEDQPREVEQLSGACILVRREAWRQIEGFDPAYFMYVEDVDFNLRLRRAGWKIFWLPEAHILHHLGGSSQSDWQTRARMVASYNQSRYLFFGRLNGPRAAHRLKAMVTLGAALRLLVWSLAALCGVSGSREKVRLFRWVWRAAGRLSPPLP